MRAERRAMAPAHRASATNSLILRKLWIGAPPQLGARPSRQLDWGTTACELKETDLPLIAHENTIEGLPPLRAGERRAALWVECY